MSWLEGALGKLATGLGSSGIAAQLVQSMGPAVLGGVVDQLNRNGLGPKVSSWLGGGENQPITADELRNALGNQKLQDLAKSLGVPADTISEVLAQHLPAAVDHASSNGTLDPSQVAPPTPAP